MIGDHALRERVELELARNPNIDATFVGVTASDGAVILSGHVPSHDDARVLSTAVQHVEGVLAIADDTVVRIPGHGHHEDSDIATRLARWLACDPDADVATREVSHDITATVRDSVVTLRGTVDSEERRRRIESHVSTLDGVRAISNQIALAGHPDPLDICARIETAFVHDAKTQSRRVQVSMHGDEAVLEGIVRGRHEQEMAVAATKGSPGVTYVIDNLDVG